MLCCVVLSAHGTAGLERARAARWPPLSPPRVDGDVAPCTPAAALTLRTSLARRRVYDPLSFPFPQVCARRMASNNNNVRCGGIQHACRSENGAVAGRGGAWRARARARRVVRSHPLPPRPCAAIRPVLCSGTPGRAHPTRGATRDLRQPRTVRARRVSTGTAALFVAPWRRIGWRLMSFRSCRVKPKP